MSDLTKLQKINVNFATIGAKSPTNDPCKIKIAKAATTY